MGRAFSISLVFFLTSCGYTMQRSQSDQLEKMGIRKVYVAPVNNQTFKAGVEIFVYNALVERVSSNNRVKIVSDEKKADAVLEGTVSQAEFSQAAGTSAINLPPKLEAGEVRKEGGDIQVATVYRAHLGCSFVLRKIEEEFKKNKDSEEKNNWSASFIRSKSFPASTQLGPAGTTSALINDSSFDRALNDLAVSMMADVHESLFAMF